MCSEDKYQSVLASRYCKNSPLMDYLSETRKASLWRQLWIWLAEAEHELGLKQINEEAIEEMKKNRDVFDWPLIRSEEKKLKHDVMAHNHAFGKICPKAAGIIHLGATSCFVQDNADLIAFRDSIDHILRRFATVLDRLSTFALENKEVVTVGRTHYQTASLVTVGKRAALWAQEFLMAFQQIAEFRDKMRFRGIKGATGTQDSFLTLFSGDEEKVEKLDILVTEKAGFKNRFLISGQTYSRQQDAQLIFALSLLGAAAKKVCTDVRVLQAFGELLEPFEKDQIGSSAMPYKKNPMKSERCCSLARKLINAPQEALTILADQGLERTLDDSAGRRILIPDCLLTAEALLTTLQNIFEGLKVQTENVKKIVEAELPFLGLEKAMMFLTEEGVDRQKAHAVIRETALAAKELQLKQRVDMRTMMENEFFDSVREKVVALVSNPLNFTGRCVSQTVKFVKEELQPVVEKYVDPNSGRVQLDRSTTFQMGLPSRKDSPYTSHYCEENIFKLCQLLEGNEKAFAVFISNGKKTIPLWSQRLSSNGSYVLWDYHVILIIRGGSPAEESLVYDLDSSLSYPTKFSEYWQKTFRPDIPLKNVFSRRFRVTPHKDFVATFSSDRQHMKNEDGTWQMPPPTWDPPNPQSPSNMEAFIEMSLEFGATRLMDETAFHDFFTQRLSNVFDK
ncbi:unnamed protein product [Caenorhabditis auriculariae]|uniref:Adenylosuccinate lyase C-terminal domain-containing protein n=1 Tax=Caenorhabditis auriculariae TaxID=2777116 RepID=A0A8S1HPX4_9PELO|nr:unnamed protein product [Caenorhabditis auriculariae]